MAQLEKKASFWDCSQMDSDCLRLLLNIQSDVYGHLFLAILFQRSTVIYIFFSKFSMAFSTMSFSFLSSCQCWQPEAEHLQLSLAFEKQNLRFALRCTSETLLIQTIIILKRVPAISIFCLEVSEHLIYRHKISHLIAWNQRFHILIELLRELILLLWFFPKLFSLSDVKVIREYLSWLSNSENNFTKVVCTVWILPQPWPSHSISDQ